MACVSYCVTSMISNVDTVGLMPWHIATNGVWRNTFGARKRV